MNLIIVLIASSLALILFLVIYLYFQNVRAKKYYKSLQIPYLGMGLTGFIRVMCGKCSLLEMEKEFYKSATSFPNSSVVAFLDIAGSPNFYLTDPNLIKAICVKDFDHFVDHRPMQTKKRNKYLHKMVGFSEGEQWKGIRAKLSPIFTTGKIKRMSEIFKKSSERMVTYLKMEMDYPNVKSMDFDLKKILPKYAMDVIASCAFGIDSKCFDVKLDEKSTFEKMANKLGFNFSAKFLLKVIVSLALSKISDYFEMETFDEESQAFFVNTIKDVMRRRRETGEKQDDFLQLMMEVQQGLVKEDEESNAILNGDMVGDEDSGKSSSSRISSSSAAPKTKLEFSDDHIIANGMQFLMAGFETSHSALLFTIYALALEQEVQERLYEEVKMVMEKNEGQLTYDGVNEMKYLDWVLSESTRRYTITFRAERCCTKTYTVPGTNLTIEKGSIVTIPMYGIHLDSRYFPNPESFIPERFAPENKASRNPYATLTFGHGPRNCIGNRFAQVKVKTAVAQMVYAYHFQPCSKTKIPLEFDNNPIVKPKDSMWLNVTVRE